MSGGAQIRVGDPLPAIAIELTFELVAMTPFATWDFFPGHHDPAFARGQGLPDIYLNTIALQGFADRIVTDWTNGQCIILRRQMKMRHPAHPGDTLAITGTVTDMPMISEEITRIAVDVRLDTRRGRICDVTTLIELPILDKGTHR